MCGWFSLFPLPYFLRASLLCSALLCSWWHFKNVHIRAITLVEHWAQKRCFAAYTTRFCIVSECSFARFAFLKIELNFLLFILKTIIFDLRVYTQSLQFIKQQPGARAHSCYYYYRHRFQVDHTSRQLCEQTAALLCILFHRPDCSKKKTE